jgi:hypothetical protein
MKRKKSFLARGEHIPVMLRVRSFEGACRKLGIDADLAWGEHIPIMFRKPLLAYYKLMVITAALNEGWRPNFRNARRKKFWIYAAWVSGGYSETGKGSDALYSLNIWEDSSSYLGSHLALKDAETAEYAIRNFNSLYEEFFVKDYNEGGGL